MENKLSTKVFDYWECPRCEINSQSNLMCPCPRGSCEAEVKGKVVITTELILDK